MSETFPPAGEPEPTPGTPVPTPTPAEPVPAAEPAGASLDGEETPRRARRLPLFLGALLAVLALGGIAVALWGQGEKPPPPIPVAGSTPATSPRDQVTGPPVGDAAKGGAVGGLSYTQALLKDIRQDRFTIGEGPVTIVEFADLQCPFCAEHQLNVVPLAMQGLVRTGRARLSMIPLGFLGKDSVRAQTVFYKLMEQGYAWQFADLMFRNHGTENTGYVTNEYLKAIVGAIPGADVAAADPTPTAATRRAAKNADTFARILRVEGTPSFAVGVTGQPLRSYLQVGSDWRAALGAVQAVELALAQRGTPGTTPPAPGQPTTPGPGTPAQPTTPSPGTPAQPDPGRSGGITA